MKTLHVNLLVLGDFDKGPKAEPVYLWRPILLAIFSSVSAASFSACITRAFLFLVSSILSGFDSGRF